MYFLEQKVIRVVSRHIHLATEYSIELTLQLQA